MSTTPRTGPPQRAPPTTPAGRPSADLTKTPLLTSQASPTDESPPILLADAKSPVTKNKDVAWTPAQITVAVAPATPVKDARKGAMSIVPEDNDDREDFSDFTGALWFLDGPESRADAREGFARVPQKLTEKRALLKHDPPYLFLMSEEDYFEFPLYDMEDVLDGLECADGGEKLDGSVASWDQRLFLLSIKVENMSYKIWLAGDSVEGKLRWVEKIKATLRILRKGQAEKPGLSWELDLVDIKMEKKVGAGQFGDVFLGQLWGKEVAIKKCKQISASALKAVQLEIGLLSQLRHPNIVLYIGAASKPPEIAIVTEWCAHGSLEDILTDPNHHFNSQQMLRYALEIAQGMNYLHSQPSPLIHRDLKSANVFVDKNLTMKVGDFGLSHAMKDMDQEIAGTPMFMAPECWGSDWNEKVDVWAFGMTLIEMINRSLPYPHLQSAEEVREAVDARRMPDIPSWVPPQLKEVILKCWEPDPSDRWSFSDIIDKLKVFSTWDAIKFYQQIDFKRLLHFLNSHDEQQCLWAVCEIAAIEAAGNLDMIDIDDSGSVSGSSEDFSGITKASTAPGISIYNSSRAEMTSFLGRLTHLITSNNPKIQVKTVSALASLFQRLSNHLTDSQLSSMPRASRSGEEKMTLDEMKKLVANFNKGVMKLVNLIVRTNKSADKRLMGLKPLLTANQRKAIDPFSQSRIKLVETTRIHTQLERESLRLLANLLGPKFAIDDLDQAELSYLQRFITNETDVLKGKLNWVRNLIRGNQALLLDINKVNLKPQAESVEVDYMLGSRSFNIALKKGRERSSVNIESSHMPFR